MRHLDVAELWHTLRNASDINYILREAISELSTVFIYEARSLAVNHIRSIVLLKAIFDVQRYHLSIQERDHRQDLEIQVLLDAISCLSTVKFTLNQSPRRSANQDHHNLLRQAFISGLRALLLGHHHPQQGLSDSLAEWSRKWDVSSPIDEQVIRPLLEDALQPHTERGHDNMYALPRADLRGPALFFLQNWASLKSNLRACLVNPEIAYVHAFWLCYDARLALFHTSYEFLLDVKNEPATINQSGPPTQSSMLDEVGTYTQELNSILQQRGVHQSRRSFAQYLEHLEPTPHCHNCRAGCSCFPPQNNHDIVNCDQELLLEMFKKLNDYLAQRTVAVFNGSHGLYRLSRRLDTRRDEWLVRQASSHPGHVYAMHGAGSSDIPSACLKGTYVLNCSGMHCVSGETLWQWMRETKMVVGSQDLYRDASSFAVNIRCQPCTEERGTPVMASFVRKILPLSQISEDLASLRAKWEQWRPTIVSTSDRNQENQSATASGAIYLGSVMSAAPDSGSVTQSSKQSSKQSRAAVTQEATSSSNRSGLSARLKRNSKGNIDLSDLPLQLIITADGRYSMVWYRSKIEIYATERQDWLNPPSLDSDIQFVCATSTVLCVVVEAAKGSKLFVFSMPNSKQLGEAVSIDDRVFCMSLSLNSTTLLLGTSNYLLRVFCAPPQGSNPALKTQQTPFRPPQGSPTGSTVESQAVAFSPNARRAVLAIRFRPDGKIKCIIYDMTKMNTFVATVSITLSNPIKLTAIRDFGLTAVACIDDETAKVTSFLVCCSVENGLQTLHTYNEVTRAFDTREIIHADGSRLDASIHKAISLPQSRIFLLLNEQGHLWKLLSMDRSPNWYSHHVSTFPLRVSSNRRPTVHLAATFDTEINVGYIDKDKVRLHVYNLRDGSCNKPDFKLQPFYS